MNEQAENVLAELMQRLLNGIDATAEFSQQQIPEILEQLLLWRFSSSAISFIFGLFLASLTTCLLIKKVIPIAKKEMNKPWLERNEVCNFVLPFLCICLYVMSFCFISFTWIKIWIAPKLFLLEYGASLIK